MNVGEVFEAWSKASRAVLNGLAPGEPPSTPSQTWVYPPSEMTAVRLRGPEVMGPSNSVVEGLSMRRLGVDELEERMLIKIKTRWRRGFYVVALAAGLVSERRRGMRKESILCKFL